MVHKDEETQIAKRLQRLEEAQARQTQEKRWELPIATRHSMHYGSQEHVWRVHNFDKRHHQHQPQHSFDFVKLPSFNGSNDPTLYLEWEAKVEHLFNVYKVTEDQKVRLASLFFLHYVIQWWQQTVMNIGLNKRSVVVSWYDLKACMRSWFVPTPYWKEILLKLQRLHQGPKMVDEYFKELETTLTKINMHDNEESKIAMFVSGLRREIQDIVELYEYSSLKKVFHLATKVESQLLKKTTFINTNNHGFYKSSWKDTNKNYTKTSPSNFSKETTSHQKVSKHNPSTSTPKSPTKTSSTKCFKCLGHGNIAANCPNKRTTMLQEVNQDQIKTKTENENERENEGQDNTGIITSPQMCFSSFLFHYLNILNT